MKGPNSHDANSPPGIRLRAATETGTQGSKETNMQTASLNRKLTGALAVTALATLATVALPAAPANAAGRCTLRIGGVVPSNDGIRRREVTNTCTAASRTDRILEYRMWGADWPDGDDFLYRRITGNVYDRVLASTRNLNEDRYTGDEIYTRTYFIRQNNSIYSVKSNEVRGEFS
jgi:hypothetical protein